MITVGMILSTRRSGSTWLNCVLGSHEPVANLGEYFRPFADRTHVACRLCEADGLSACRVLFGIESVPEEDAFTFASERTGKSIIVECSKLLHWPLQFVKQEHLDVRFIHLVRNPCGYVESELRRRPGVTAGELVAEWSEQNAHIETFCANVGRPHVLVSYEQLADEPLRAFPPLCEFLGFSFEPAALQYWKVEHHGLGGNGACSLYLRGRKLARFNTGDDAYYASLHDRPAASDGRWRERLDAVTQRNALASPYVRSMAERLQVHWA